MWDDVLNKTNQGNGFKGFREELMNIVIGESINKKNTIHIKE